MGLGSLTSSESFPLFINSLFFSFFFFLFLIGKKVILLIEKKKRYTEFTIANKEQHRKKIINKGIKNLF